MSQRSSIEIHQGLFGYQDGHRLLASSLQLDDESAATVLTLSDLATASGEVGSGYWTGVPLTQSKCYALIRTWLAPEMPRPGCAWSHVLYIKFSDMGRIPDLGAVGRLTRYPAWPLALVGYQSPLDFEVQGHESASEQLFTRVLALQVLRRIYLGGVTNRQDVSRASLEAVTFEIWSQQWPRLRRSFSFRTTGQGFYPRSVGDLTTERVESELPAQTAGELDPRGWEAAAIEDLFDTHGGEFRQFVWRYGSDVRQGRDRFVFLAGMFVAMRSKTLVGPEVRALLDRLSRELSDPADGKLLKQHIMAAGQARFSLVPPCDGLEILEFYSRSGKASGLPAPDEGLLETLGNDWPVGSDRLLRVTSALLDEKEPFGDQLARRIARVAKAGSLLSDGAGYPNVLRIAVSEEPSLLDDKAIGSLEPSLIGELLQSVPDGDDLGHRMVDRLFGINDAEIAQIMARKAPDAVLRRLISDLSAAARGASEVKGSAWLAAGRRVAAAVDPSTALDRVAKLSELAAWCWLFDYSTTVGRRLPISTWAAAFSRSTNDVGNSEKISVYAYAFILASVRPERGCETLLELTFAPLHHAILRNALTPRARALLESYLPPLAWWKNWDMGVRLKQGVVNAFVGGQLDVSSFLRLTSNTYDMEQLVELAEDTQAGRRYLGQLRADER